MAILFSTFAANAQAQPNGVETNPHPSTEQTLTKEKLDRVKRYILASGTRCTYVNMYNNNPCMDTSRFRLYLNPDPGPNGHPQLNINCDIRLGDFNTLVVQDKHGASGFHTIVFIDPDAILIKGEEKNSRSVLNKAVQEVLRRIDSEVYSQGKPGK
jgi:hypothetical protein